MILTTPHILAEVQFEPNLDEFQVNPHSIDLRVDDTYIILPGKHIIAKSMESITLPNDIMAVVYPRSSLNRSNVTLDMTGVVDAGYSGQLIMPLTNHSDKIWRIRVGQRISSLIFHRLETEVTPRLSKYHNSDGKLVADKEEEVSFLEAGNIEGLKLKYGLA